MKLYSTLQAARLLRISRISLQRYIAAGKVSAPRLRRVAGMRVRAWTKADIKRVKKELPRIKNGRRKRRKK